MQSEKTGYAAIDKESGRGLNVAFTDGINRLSLTEDPRKIHLARSASDAEIYAKWYNNSHKNKKEFEIKMVAIVTTLKIV